MNVRLEVPRSLVLIEVYIMGIIISTPSVSHGCCETPKRSGEYIFNYHLFYQRGMGK